jgi:hypothetical protein
MLWLETKRLVSICSTVGHETLKAGLNPHNVHVAFQTNLEYPHSIHIHLSIMSMSSLCAFVREGAVSIPVRSSVAVHLRLNIDNEMAIFSLYSSFETAPLLKYSKLARRILMEEPFKAVVSDCCDTNVHPQYYDSVVQWLADTCFQWERIGMTTEVPKILHGNITSLNDALGIYAALLTFDLVRCVQQNWIRTWIMRYIEMRVLTPAEVTLVWLILRVRDVRLVEYAVDSVIELWDKDVFIHDDFVTLTFMREKV